MRQFYSSLIHFTKESTVHFTPQIRCHITSSFVDSLHTRIAVIFIHSSFKAWLFRPPLLFSFPSALIGRSGFQQASLKKVSPSKKLRLERSSIILLVTLFPCVSLAIPFPPLTFLSLWWAKTTLIVFRTLFNDHVIIAHYTGWSRSLHARDYGYHLMKKKSLEADTSREVLSISETAPKCNKKDHHFHYKLHGLEWYYKLCHSIITLLFNPFKSVYRGWIYIIQHATIIFDIVQLLTFNFDILLYIYFSMWSVQSAKIWEIEKFGMHVGTNNGGVTTTLYNIGAVVCLTDLASIVKF